MNFSPPDDAKPTQGATPVLVADGGLPFAPLARRDSMVVFFELMEVVELLCVRWPERRVSMGRDFRL